MTLPYEIPGIELLYSESAHNYNFWLITVLIIGSILALIGFIVVIYKLCTDDYDGIIIDILFTLFLVAFIVIGWCCIDSFAVYIVKIDDTLSFLDFEKYYRIYEKISDSVYKIIEAGG